MKLTKKYVFFILSFLSVSLDSFSASKQEKSWQELLMDQTVQHGVDSTVGRVKAYWNATPLSDARKLVYPKFHKEAFSLNFIPKDNSLNLFKYLTDFFYDRDIVQYKESGKIVIGQKRERRRDTFASEIQVQHIKALFNNVEKYWVSPVELADRLLGFEYDIKRIQQAQNGINGLIPAEKIYEFIKNNAPSGGEKSEEEGILLVAQNNNETSQAFWDSLTAGTVQKRYYQSDDFQELVTLWWELQKLKMIAKRTIELIKEVYGTGRALQHYERRKNLMTY